MRGGYGASQGALEVAIGNLGKQLWEQKGSGDLGQIEIASDTTFADSGWVFINPHTGQEYPKRLVDMSHEEAMDVCSVLFSKVRQQQEQLLQLEKQIKQRDEDLELFHKSAALQLLR